MMTYSVLFNWRTGTAIFLGEKIRGLRPYLKGVRLTKFQWWYDFWKSDLGGTIIWCGTISHKIGGYDYLRRYGNQYFWNGVGGMVIPGGTSIKEDRVVNSTFSAVYTCQFYWIFKSLVKTRKLKWGILCVVNSPSSSHLFVYNGT